MPDSELYQKLFDKLLEKSITFNRLKDAYIAIRLELKRLGHTEKTINRVDQITPELHRQQLIFESQLRQLKKELKSWTGFDDFQWVTVYIQHKMKPLNDLFPLNDGDNKRRDTRDENPE